MAVFISLEVRLLNSRKKVFSQTMDCLPKDEFRGCVDRYQGNLASYYV